ncbi:MULTISPECIES: energy transducer TonB [Shewanella]|uniref:Protein TonB n=1 Tax=Shewanella psychromarinicola TaxID=2487742 RepID=A0A3N4EIW1_9GAMM|nr:energy transducer TonB [Shewanella psychromarinicola]AZG36329.1 energy transducer TonB [Shewanella psychromarinicola]MCL1080799.1 energy transducer TonB [Shewanella psychromarinicola]RPA34170.1 energy transducer TonB [Shewanella psychromarinicola]
MKYSTLALISLVFITACSSTPLPDRSNAALKETANPTYPIHAARNKIEGYVQMSFDISEKGDPINIKVLKSVPEQTFDKAAISALSNWKYAPKVENGKAVVQQNMTVRLDFKMG